MIQFVRFAAAPPALRPAQRSLCVSSCIRSENSMKIHEYQGKDILRNAGIPVPNGIPAFTVQEPVRVGMKQSKKM